MKMNNKSLLSLGVVVGLVGLAGLGYFKKHNADDAIVSNDSVKTRSDVERIIREYTVENPEFLEEAMKNLYMKKQKADTEKSSQAVKERIKELAENAADPHAGSATPKVTIVEFFDYNCGYCKKMIENEKKIVAELKDVRIVFKEFPILGDNSRMLAKAALAVNIADSSKYFAFHAKLMQSQAEIKPAELESIVQDLGVDMAKYKAALNDSKIDKQLADNFQLASDIGLRGTPAYIVGDQLAPGALSFDEVKKLVDSQAK